MFYGIGVGVGSSEGVTKRAVTVLNNLDILYVPTAKEDNEFSRAQSIVEAYLKENIIIKPRHFPMNYNSDQLQSAWQSIASEIEDDVKKGFKTGFVTIGDPMIYSTYIYLLRILKDKIDIETIPGITSFLDIASRNNFPLVEGDSSLVIIPATVGTEKIQKYLRDEDSIVLMKVYKNFDDVIKIIEEENLLNCSIAVSNSSKENEVVYKDIRKVRKEDISYFTTILINKKWVIK